MFNGLVVSKNKAIKTLKKVKLVIGNGFDLQCKLHSSYKDYFENFGTIKESIEKWVRMVGFPGGLNTLKRFISNYDDINIWDCFFYYKIKQDIELKKWCDVETEMLKSFLNNGSFRNNSFWGQVFRCCDNTIYNLPNNDVEYVALFIQQKTDGRRFKDLKDFYFYLLDELRKFEHRFGEFIHQQQNFVYEQQYELLVEELCGSENLISIDSFNYTVLRKAGLQQVNNINGNYEKPIFGIDSKNILVESPEYIFTKTYRRIENDTDNGDVFTDQEFENIVIYGHSLSPHDYSYFFPIMDKLKLYDFTQKGQMVFAYCVYDKEKENEIKTMHRFAIAKLIEAYANYKGLTEPNRLLDSLSIFRRVWLYELSK